MKTWYTILFFKLIITSCLANVWQGNIVIKTQAEADAFRNVCACTSINGNLVITGSDVQHVDSLYEVTYIVFGREPHLSSQAIICQLYTHLFSPVILFFLLLITIFSVLI